MDRRQFVRYAGAATVAGVAGCVGGEPDVSDDSSDTTAGEGRASDSPSTTTGGNARTVDAHPAAADLADQPRYGDLGGHVVLAFEDPSCPRCAAFHRQTVPKIRSNLVDAGSGAYVYRNYPVVYPWGGPATQALESTFARDEGAFWALLDHYFANQDSFSTDTVLEQTASFLDDATDLDGAAVATDAREKAHDDAVQADRRAASDAGLSRVTPTVLLFRDGEYVTTATGSVSYEVVATALGE